MADETRYQFSALDYLTAPADADNLLPRDPNDPDPEDPARSVGAFRSQVLSLLTEIRDLLADEGS